VIELDKVPADIEKISVCVTIHDAEARRQNFGMVSSAYVRCVNARRQHRSRPFRPVRGRLGRNRDDFR
jgi:stress response protein SCP2